MDTSAFRKPQKVPLAPHPYAHHTRSPCADDTCVFLTNIAQLPPPDAVPYPGPDRVRLEEWENHLGHNARGWMEGGELFNEEESWAVRWPYSAAVDDDPRTAFRSPDGKLRREPRLCDASELTRRSTCSCSSWGLHWLGTTRGSGNDLDSSAELAFRTRGLRHGPRCAAHRRLGRWSSLGQSPLPVPPSAPTPSCLADSSALAC